MCTPPCRQSTQRTCRLRAAPTADADGQHPNCKRSQPFTARIRRHRGRYPGTRQSSTVPSWRCVLIQTRQPTKNRGSVWSRCSVCWRVGLLQAFRRDRFASKGKSMCTVNAASVEPAGRKEVSGVARLKPWSARALLKRESERCSARPEKAKCQPGLFGRACLEKQRRRSDVAWFYNGMASLENGMFKGRGR